MVLCRRFLAATYIWHGNKKCLVDVGMEGPHLAQGGRRGSRSPARVAGELGLSATHIASTLELTRLLCGNRKCGLRPRTPPSSLGYVFLGTDNVRFRHIAVIHGAPPRVEYAAIADGHH